MARTSAAVAVLLGLLAGNAAAARTLAGTPCATGAATPKAMMSTPGAASTMSATAAAPVTLTSSLAGAPADQFSTLLAAVKAAGLAEALDKPDLAFTIFAPTNDAFAKLLAALNVTPAALLADKALLTKVLSYHVVPAVAQSKSLKNMQKLPTLLKDQGLTVDLSKAGTVTIAGATNKAKVVVADVMAGKSVVHVVDTVLVPK